MSPGDTLFIHKHAFTFETEQDDGCTLFLRAEEETARSFAERMKREGVWFELEGSFRATEGRISAVQEARTGALRVKLELRDSMPDALYLFPTD